MRTETITEFSERKLKEYGTHVVEQRALPDYRDGLKPVHRMILWAMYKLGAHSTSSFVKGARVVGDTIGKYHPHSDASVYDALVGMAGTKMSGQKEWYTKNISQPLVEGFGNWGDSIDPAAAMRYTECRLSVFADTFLLDKDYLQCVPYLPNFSESEQVPLIFPARIPVLLLNGSVSIAFGIAAETPCFALSSVVYLCESCLKGSKPSIKELVKHIKFDPPYGGVCVSSPEEIAGLIKTGYGSLKFQPKIDMKDSVITISSCCPGLTSKSQFDRLCTELDKHDQIEHVVETTDRSGFKYEVTIRRSVKGDDRLPILDFVRNAATKSSSYSIGVTDRTLAGASFSKISVLQLVGKWCAWRIDLEKKVAQYLLTEEEKKLARQKLMLTALDNLEVIIASLRVEDSAAFLVKKLKITLDEANTILDFKVRQLKSLEKSKVLKTVKEIEAMMLTLRKRLSKPVDWVLKDLEELKQTRGL